MAEQRSSDAARYRVQAVVVRDDAGAAVAAISVAGPADRLPRELAGSKMAAQVVTAAAGISERLGYIAWRTPISAVNSDPNRALFR